MRILSTALVGALLILAAPAAHAGPVAAPLPGTMSLATAIPFDAFEKRLLAAIAANNMGVVAQACADCGARNVLGKEIPKNRVIMIFHPRYAVPMLEAFVPAGIEAPMRLYLTEERDGTARITYRKPSALFAPYRVPDLTKMGEELDELFAKIVADARK